jgi:hypothetical protein
VIRVDGSGDAPTVQAGIDSSRHGDTVLVGPGTYYENIDLKGRQIHLKGEEGAEATILDGSRGDTSVIACHSGETLDTIIEGFTITGGVGQVGCARQGGGIYILSSAAVIRGNVIRGNTAIATPPCFASFGGGMEITDSSAPVLIEGNLIEDNFSTGLGGGISLGTPCVVQDNVIRLNRTGKGDGGGVYIGAGRGPITVRRNLIVENTANDHGGGIYISNAYVPASMMEVTRNLIIGNAALGADYPGGATDGAGGGCWMSGHGCYFHHNTVAFNRAEANAEAFPPTGGVDLQNPEADVRVEYNIICQNEAGGIGVYGIGGAGDRWTATLTRNLIFDNGPEDIQSGTSDPRAEIEVILQENIFADPLFCVIGAVSRGELAFGSPALTQPFGVIGAVDHGSCEPNTAAQAPKTTWQTIKAIYPH